MSIFKRPKSPYWYTEFEVKGRRVVRSTRTTSARDARAFEKRLRDHVAREAPKPVQAASITVDQACGKYWKEHGRKLADARNVERWLKYIVRHIGRELELKDMSSKSVTAMVHSLEEAGVGRVSINRTVTCLQGVHNRAAKKWEETVKVINWKEQKTREIARDRWIEVSQAQRLLAELPEHIRLVVLFMLTTGLRQKEAFNLVWTAVNLERSIVNVKVKGGRFRDVLLSPEAAAVIAGAPRTGRYVFDTTNYRKSFTKALQVAEVDNFRWHDLRHTFATWLGQAGVPLDVIRDQLGHSSISVTQKYRHVNQREVRAALQKLPSVTPAPTTVIPMRRS